MKKAIHYIACDSIKYFKEAEASAVNFRKHTSDAHIKIYTDLKQKSNAFDEVINVQNLIPGGKISKEWTEGKLYFEEKIKLLARSDYEFNLYLDGDIQTTSNTDDIFELLNKFDMAVAHDAWRTNIWSNKMNIPKCFPEFNLGIILYRKNDTTLEFFHKWEENFKKYPQPHDQPAFRLTMWENPIKYATLPPEYNHRPPKYTRDVKPIIIHGRGKGFLKEISSYENPITYI